MQTLESAEALRAAGAVHHVIDGSGAATNTQLFGPYGTNVNHRILPARGVSDAFNAGVAEANGEWLWFLNGGDRVDSRLSPDFLFTLLRCSQADVIIGGVTYDSQAELRAHFPLSQQWPPLAAWIPHPATLVRRSLFDRFGPFDERYRITMDYEWWLRALRDDTRVDVLAVPFARFASGGMSQRAESLPLIASERDDAIRRHQAGLWKAWISRGFALAKSWTRAQFATRLKKQSRSS